MGARARDILRGRAYEAEGVHPELPGEEGHQVVFLRKVGLAKDHDDQHHRKNGQVEAARERMARHRIRARS